MVVKWQGGRVMGGYLTKCQERLEHKDQWKERSLKRTKSLAPGEWRLPARLEWVGPQAKREVLGTGEWGSQDIGEICFSEEEIKLFAAEVMVKGQFYPCITIQLPLWLSSSTFPSEVLCIVLCHKTHRAPSSQQSTCRYLWSPACAPCLASWSCELPPL